MHNKLTERFIECLNLIKEQNNIPSNRQFAKAIGIHNQCLSDITTGKRPVNADHILKLVTSYNINANYIFSGEGAIFDNLDGNNKKPIPDNGIITIVTNEEGQEKIVHVPVAAQAGYIDQFLDPVFIEELPTFNLPDSRFSTGTHRCFDITGDSMEPSLFAGEKLVCSYIDPENWAGNLRNNYVYVIVTSSGLVVKRIVNWIKDSQELILKSDNSFYDNYTIPIEEVKEIWLVTYKISPFMPSPNNIRNALHKEVDSLRSTISDQSKMILSLNTTIEKMLKQNRMTSARY